MISEDVQRVELEARKRSLEEYKLRCQDLRSENEALKSEKDQREADALQIISFLRRDAERKDELIESLKGTINQQREIFAQQREEERQQTAAKMQAQEVDFKQIEGRLRAQLDAVQSELRELTEFKEQKTALEEKLEQGASDRADLEGEHKETVAAMERRFFEEKARLQKEYAAQFGAISAQFGAAQFGAIILTPLLHPRYKQMLAEMKKTSQEEAVERLDASTKKILFENRRMAEELRLQVQETDELQKAKRYLEEENKKLKREVQLNEQSVKEYDGTRLGRGAHSQGFCRSSRASASRARSRSSAAR